MIDTNELTIESEDYDKAFTEVSFLLDMFVETIEAFVGKSTPSLAVAAGRKMAANMPIHLPDTSPEKALDEFIRVFKIQQMEIEGEFNGPDAVININHCPIAAVCTNRELEIGGPICSMFHYYVAGVMAELAGCPARPKTISTSVDACQFKLSFTR
ncbi:MAG: hypothetical protein OCC45_01630 [Desulfotalea sp.]